MNKSDQRVIRSTAMTGIKLEYSTFIIIKKRKKERELTTKMRNNTN